jgi:N-methylhydantoinase A
VAEAVRKPVYLLNSGPAAGPSGSVFLGKFMDKQNFVTIDMGGTSLDIGFVKDGVFKLSESRWIDEEMTAIKMVDITTIGSGGGSFAWFDSMNLLRVGPKSVGADPGPACYSKGGIEPAVTDADLILGYIPEDYFLGGSIPLNIAKGKTAVGKVAERLHMTVEEAAHAIFAVVNSNMADAISVVTTKNGHDVRDFTLFAFGGAGPTHAVFLAEALGIPEIIIPPFASSFCAWSMYSLKIGRDYLCPYITSSEVADIDTINKLYRDMIERALSELKSFGAGKQDIEINKYMEFRYRSQFHDVEVADVPDGDLSINDFNAVVEAFHRRHEELYSFSLQYYDVELRSLRIIAKVKQNTGITIKELESGTKDPSNALKRERACFFDSGFIKTQVYDSEKLKAGNLVIGPAIIEVPTTTVVIPKYYGCHVDKYGNYLIRRT